MLELAVFGSMLILVLGMLINYGLGADFNQQAAMESFRKALGDASTSGKGTATIVLIKDRHIANPAHPFAFGQIIPISSSASVVKDPLMQVMPQVPDDLPTVTLAIGADAQGRPQQQMEFMTAGFRTETVAQATLERYRLVYGSTNVCSDPTLNCGAGNLVCLEWDTDPQTGQQVCVNWQRTIRIVDSCEGQIISLESCVQQGRMIADDAFCQQQCQKTQSVVNPMNCAVVCAQPINPTWYSNGCGANGCPALDALFAGVPRLGVQPGYTKQLTTNDTLTTSQNSVGATTTASEAATEVTTRTVITNQGAGQAATATVTTQKDVDANANWSTSW